MKNIPIKLRGRFIENDLFSLKVFSIHEGVINLLNQNANYLISLIDDKKNMTGLSLLVPDLFNNTFHIPQIGQSVFLHEMGINLLETIVWIDYITLPPGQLNSRIKELNIIKKQIDPGMSFLSLIINETSTEFQKKAKEILNNQIQLNNHMIDGLEGLVGLGQGLTPSGDDFITGVLLAESWLMDSVMINKSNIRNALNKTTYAGRSLLHLAIEGSFPAYLITFINNLIKSDSETNLLAAIDKASQHGSTSGMDSLAGLYWYCMYINDPKS